MGFNSGFKGLRNLKVEPLYLENCELLWKKKTDSLMILLTVT